MLFSKNHLAKVINKSLSESNYAVYPSSLTKWFSPDTAMTFVQEAMSVGYLDQNYRILTTHRNMETLNGVVESAEAGDKVVVVKDGKSHEAVVADNVNGKFKLAFTDESPDDHDDEKEYSDAEFGISDDEES